MFYTSDSISTAYRNYYEAVLRHHHNNPTLLALWGKDPLALETQINVSKDGEPIPDSRKFKDPETGEVWGPTRWPYNASSPDRNYNDPAITYDIGRRCEAIGTTWWDWRNQQSIRLGFDVDSIVGHAEGVGVADDIIRAIAEIKIPWIEIVRSTRGRGLHLYVVFGPPYPKTLTHSEHAALARAYLSKVSLLTGLDFEASTDACGSILWIWSKAATPENRGFELIKPATEVQTAADVPLNWQDHLSVIGGSRAKVVVRGDVPGLGETASGDDLEEMSRVHARIPLDPTHKHCIDWIVADGEFTVAWVQDHHLLQTHTRALKKYADAMAAKGDPLRGVYETTAPATDPGKPNCFLRPRSNGAWDVYRFGQGTTEHPLWGKQGHWTHITFNQPPSFEQLMQAAGGLENPDPRQGYTFTTFADICRALSLLKANVDWPERAKTGERTFSLKYRSTDGKVMLTISKDRTDKQGDFSRFVSTPKGWCAVLGGDTVKMGNDKEAEVSEILLKVDSVARVLKQKNYSPGDSSTSGGAFAGWMVREKGGWYTNPLSHVPKALKAAQYDDIEEAMGLAILNPWTLVTEPFKPEFPGGRRWNRDAPQLRFKPAELGPDEVPKHPWWDRYLNTLGKDLDPYVKTLAWCKDWGIYCGGDYLKMWIACVFRTPFCRLPYLFFYGPQNTGKSMFHESIARLVTRGVESGDKALTSDYNGELLNCILAYIEEVDVKKSGKGVYNKVKAYLTAPTLSIRPLYHQAFEVRNCLHIVQSSNDLASMPIGLGDTRITAIYVAPLEDPIPKHELEGYLDDEAPHFMRTLFDMDIPAPQSRLALEIIETASRRDAINMTVAPVKDFLVKRCHTIDGSLVTFEEFFSKVKEMFEQEDGKVFDQSRGDVEEILIGMGFPIGTYRNQKHIGNLSFDSNAKASQPYVCVEGSLVKEKETS